MEAIFGKSGENRAGAPPKESMRQKPLSAACAPQCEDCPEKPRHRPWQNAMPDAQLADFFAKRNRSVCNFR